MVIQEEQGLKVMAAAFTGRRREREDQPQYDKEWDRAKVSVRLKGAKTGRCRFRHQRVADKRGGVTAAVQGMEKRDQRRE